MAAAAAPPVMVQAADGTLPIPGASAQSASGGALAQQARDTRSQIERLENAQVRIGGFGALRSSVHWKMPMLIVAAAL